MKKLLAFLLLFFCVQIWANMLSNGSFESKLENWRPYWYRLKKGDTFKLDDAISKDGEYSFKADVKDSSSRLGLACSSGEINEGENYLVSFFYYTQVQNFEGSFSFRIGYKDENGRHAGYFGQRQLPATGNLWIEAQIPLTVPAGVKNAALEFNFYGPSEVWLDDVSFKEISAEDLPDFDKLYANNSPLYESLFLPGTKPAKPRVYPYWTYYVSTNYYNTAEIIGVEHSSEGQFKEAAEYNLATFFHSFHRNFPQFTNKYNTPVLYYPMVNTLAKIKANKASESGRLWHNDPEFVKLYLEVIEEMDIRQGLPEDIEKLVFIADEWLGGLTSVELANRDEAEWQKVNEQVKAEYGFGKFTAPENNADDDPFKRIAWLRYNADKSVETLKAISDALKAKYPDCKIVGFDEWAAATPHDWSRLGPLVDIQPGQVLPLENGYRQFAPAYISKFHADLSGAPVYPYLQFIKYPTSITNERLYEWCDRLFQGGAEGIYVGAVEWFDRSVGHPIFSSPEKWEAMLNIIKRTQNMPKLRLPENPKMALHFGSYSLMAKLRNPANKLYPIFGLLGPRCRSWFKITDDFQVDRNPQLWDAYKVVVITEEKYISENMQKAIESFLNRGGTLLVLDQDAFSYRIDGEDLSVFREKIFGAKISKAERSSLKILTLEGLELPNTASTNYKIELIDSANTRVLAEFDDKSPAFIEHKYGKGKVLLAAFQCNNDFVVDSVEWVEQWRKWLNEEMNIKLDEEIWRFQIPRDQISEKIWRKYACVSGNALQYVRNFPETFMNHENASVNYEYKIAPVAIPDDGKKLINRIEAKDLKKNSSGVFTEKEELLSKNWITKFGVNETAANEITFTFNKKYPLRYLRLFYSGTLPSGTVEVKVADQWIKQAKFESANVGKDIKELAIDLQAEAQEAKITFAEREASSTLSLIEIDFWAEK